MKLALRITSLLISILILLQVFIFSNNNHLVFAANPSADIDQCGNGPVTSPETCTGANWVNGNLGASKAHYLEGDFVPYRIKMDNLGVGTTHSITIEWDTTKSGKHALDYLGTYNATETTGNDPCSGVSGCNLGGGTTFPIPIDPRVTAGQNQIDDAPPGATGGDDIAQTPGVFTFFGGTINSVSVYSLTGSYAGDSSTRITITFTASVVNPVLAWSGHIGTRANWGANNSAISITGSPYHMRLLDLDGSGGNQDRSLSAEAIIFPATITVIKDAVPNNIQDFVFTTTGTGLTGFTLDDDGDNGNGTSNTRVFTITDFANSNGDTKTITEGAVSGWGLTGLTCTENGNNVATVNIGTRTATLTVNEGDVFSCTYTNELQQGTLTVIKNVVNNNGGTATASDFNLHVKSGGTDVAGSPAAGSATGTIYTLNAGAYNVSEDAPISGYTNISNDTNNGDCDANGNVTVVAGQNKTCTITNDDNAAHLIVIKNVVNDNGGTATASDFTMNIAGVTATGGNSFAGAESPGTNKTLTTVGSYSVGETGPTGYAASFSADCEGTIALGQTKTCTVTNDDIAPQLTVIKHVINDDGGSLQAGDFTMNVTGTSVSDPSFAGEESPGTTVTLSAGAYSVDEDAVSGYTKSLGNDCSGNISVGQSKTCTITNDDQPGTLIVQKIVVNDNGGTLGADDFTFQVNGDTPVSFESDGENSMSVDAGVYNVNEPAVSGYSTFYSNCLGMTVPNGGSATCTITNDDIAPSLTLNKLVINDNGGTALASAWTLSATGSTSISGVGPQVLSGTSFSAGTYALSETSGPSGYLPSNWVCQGGNQSGDNITLGLDEDATCTITNDDQPATLIVRKVVINDNGGSLDADDFSFQVNGGGAQAFETDGQNDLTVDAGNYTVVEPAVAGYTTTDTNCSNLSIPNGGTATCTVTNDDQPARLIVIKTVVNNNGGSAVAADFTMAVAGANVSNPSFPGVVSPGTGLTLNAGNFDVTESGPAGYSATTLGECTGTIANGETKTCNYINDDIQPRLIVIKTVINNNGGTAVSGDFSMLVTGVNANPTLFPGQAAPGTGVALDAGQYLVGEITVPGYADSFSADCQGTIAVGQTKTCTVTNDDISPTLTVNKIVNPTTDNGLFDLQIDGTTAGTGDDVGHGGTTGQVDVDAGSHSVGEIAGAQTDLDDYEGVIGGDCDVNGNITLALAQDAVCTITNTREGSIEIVKDAQPNDEQDFNLTGGVLGNFTLDDDNNIDPTYERNKLFDELLPGSFTFNETLPNTFWTLASITCIDLDTQVAYADITTTATGVTVNLAAGKNVQCTFVNTKQSPTRTQGFWQTHTLFTTSIFSNPNYTYPWFSANSVKIGNGISNQDLITTPGRVFGAFYSNIAKKSNNQKRNEVDKARMQLAQQLMAAKLNCAAFSCATSIQTLITQADTAYAGNNAATILSFVGQLDAYNQSGDTLAIPAIGKATPQQSQTIADLPFWDSP